MINAFLIRVLLSSIDLIYLTDSIKNDLYLRHRVTGCSKNRHFLCYFKFRLRSVFYKKKFFKRLKNTPTPPKYFYGNLSNIFPLFGPQPWYSDIAKGLEKKLH